MADIWSQYGMSLPMGASPRDPVVGQTEWGAPVYQSPLGHQYYEPIESTSAPQQRGSVVRALADQVANQPITSTIGAVARALGEGMWGAFSAPGRALSGEPVTMGDVWDTAGMAQLGAAAMPAPAGALRSGGMRNLYHGTSDDAAEAIAQSGRINGPAYLTPNYSTAADYAQGGRVLSVDVPEGRLMIDLDLPGGKLLSIEDAASYIDEPDWSLDDFIRRGYSVGVMDDLEYVP